MFKGEVGVDQFFPVALIDETDFKTSVLGLFPLETRLLLHFEDILGSTNITDSSLRSNVVYASNSPTIDTAQYKFGSSSLRMNNKYFVYPVSIDWELGNKTKPQANAIQYDFTLDFWIMFDTVPSAIRHLAGTAIISDRIISITVDASGHLNLSVLGMMGGSSININDSGFVVNTGVWYHVAYVKSGTTHYFFRDGTLVGSDVLACSSGSGYLNFYSVTTHLFFGAYGSGSPVGFDGWIDEVHVDRYARWVSGFTPPSSPYSPYSQYCVSAYLSKQYIWGRLSLTEVMIPRLNLQDWQCDLQESGKGNYWIQFGNPEFEQPVLYQCVVEAVGCLPYRFPVDATVSSSSINQQQVRDAMKLAPSVGAPVSGSVDDLLGGIGTKTTNLPSDPASQSVILNAISNIQNSTNFVGIVDSPMIIPDAGSNTYNVYVRLFDLTGLPMDPDANNVHITIITSTGTVLIPSSPMTRTGVGRYVYIYSVLSTDAKASINVFFDYLLSAVSVQQVRSSEKITEADAVDIHNILSNTVDIKAKTDLLNFTGSDVKSTLDGETVDISANSKTFMKDVIYSREVTDRHTNQKPKTILMGTGGNQVTVNTTVDVNGNISKEAIA